MGHIEGRQDADLHDENGEHRFTARTAKGSDVEQHERRIKAHIEAHRAEGPRWRVMRGEELIGRAEQWSNDRNVVDLDNPNSVADYEYIAMSSKWSHTATQELREVEPGVHHVYAVREPYEHGQGYEHEDTSIRIIDTWRYGK